MNKELKFLYKKYWNNLLVNAQGTKAAHPLLIMVNDDYIRSDVKVMIIGQETDKWHGLLEEKQKSIDYLMDDYYHYLYNIPANKNNLVNRLNKKSKRSFWNRNNFKFYTEELTQVFKHQKVSFLWNNVSKIGKCARGKQTDLISELEEKYFKKALHRELEILQPDIVIFVTGDRKIPLNHGPIKKIKHEQVSKIQLDDFPNILAIRTYHPNAKIKNGKKHLKKQVIDLIKEKFT